MAETGIPNEQPKKNNGCGCLIALFGLDLIVLAIALPILFTGMAVEQLFQGENVATGQTNGGVPGIGEQSNSGSYVTTSLGKILDPSTNPKPDVSKMAKVDCGNGIKVPYIYIVWVVDATSSDKYKLPNNGPEALIALIQRESSWNIYDSAPAEGAKNSTASGLGQATYSTASDGNYQMFTGGYAAGFNWPASNKDHLHDNRGTPTKSAPNDDIRYSPGPSIYAAAKELQGALLQKDSYGDLYLAYVNHYHDGGTAEEHSAGEKPGRDIVKWANGVAASGCVDKALKLAGVTSAIK